MIAQNWNNMIMIAALNSEHTKEFTPNDFMTVVLLLQVAIALICIGFYKIKDYYNSRR